MSAPSPILIELVLVLGLVLAFGFWELYSLRKDRERTEERRRNDDPEASNPSEDPPG